MLLRLKGAQPVPSSAAGTVIGAPLAVAVRSATKRYGDALVLDRVSLDIEPGEFVTLLGPSGSGKTTLLNILMGFVQPDAGTVLIGGEDVTRLPPHRRGIGIVFQNYALFPHMTVAENIAFPLRARRIGRAEIQSRVERTLDLVKLDGFGARAVEQLSGGQKQRVALARAVVFQPKVILMDEPLSALDKQLREHMQIEIRALHERIDATTVYVTHDQREALTMSDRIAVLNGGRLAQLGTPREIYDRPGDAFVAAFVGEAVLAPVARLDDHTVSLGGRPVRTAKAVAPSGDLRLVLRSEKLRLAEPGEENTIEGVVVRRMFQGETQMLLIQGAEGLQFPVRQHAHVDADLRLPEEGDRAAFFLHPEHAVVVAGSGSGPGGEDPHKPGAP